MTQHSEHTETPTEHGQENPSGRLREESFGKLICAIRENVQYEGLLHPALDVVESYDEKHQTDLLHTLRVYLDNDCNAQRCGRLLYLHRNSLKYRIHRIQEISGCDLSNPDERSYLRISFLLR